MTGVFNSPGEKDCLHCHEDNQWKHTCPKLSTKERTELNAPGRPHLINVAVLDKDVYATKDTIQRGCICITSHGTTEDAEPTLSIS